MSSDNPPALLSPALSRLLGWVILYVVLVIGCFSYPSMPSSALDPSWRMALGYFFENNMQFGKDVVFTYGPLGFIMGRTFSGLQFWGLIAGQLTLAVISATVILRQSLLLRGYVRYGFITFILLFGILYEDALHMIIIQILGFELLRLKDSPRYFYIALIGAVLAFYSQIKFTDLLLTAFILTLVVGYGAYRREWRAALCLTISFSVVYAAIWMGCGQSLSNLPAYFHASWEISQGYLWAMGIPAPYTTLWKGLIVLFGIIIYAVVHLVIHPDKPRAIANTLLLGAFIYLNWKHGFVRADGHMIGFFFCAMLPITTYPWLLNDSKRFAKLHHWGFVLLGLMSIWGLHSVQLNVISQSLANLQNKVWFNVTQTLDWDHMRDGYRDQLQIARNATDMLKTKQVVEQSTLDVLGSEQGVALFNRFNYQPRPVIQGYSAYTPMLAELNRDFYASENAPEYVLMKVQSIDYRLPTMDDSHVLRMLPHRYEFVHSDNGFTVWKRKEAPFNPARSAPRSLFKNTLTINSDIALEEHNQNPLWIKLDLQPSLLGKIRSFFYKPPQVKLRIINTDDSTREYLMPLPQGRTGFIINPIIEDQVDYMRFSSGTSDKLLRSLAIVIDPKEEKFFASQADVEISTLPVTKVGFKFFPPSTKDMFPMFESYPLTYESYTPLSEGKLAGEDFAILHAPSKMIFDLPYGATKLTGEFGFMENAYTQGNNTNGAHFVIYWSDGTRRSDLYQRILDPMRVEYDRGIQTFDVSLTHLSGGRLYFEILPGARNDFSYDWAGWSKIKISR